MRKGILYIATGSEYIQEAKRSAQYVRSVVDYPIALITDQQVNDYIFDEVIIDPEPQNTYIDKPRNLGRTPFDQTIFIDTDSYIINDVGELFDLLEFADLAAVVDPNEDALRLMNERYYDTLPESIPEYNTGMLVYSSAAVNNGFFQRWEENYSQDHSQDQISFRKTIAETDLQFTALSNVYNCLIDWPMQVTGEVKILHDISRKLTSENIEDVKNRINKSTEPRILYSGQDRVVYPLSEFGNRIAYILYTYNIFNYGIVNTSVKAIRSVCNNGIIKTLHKVKKNL